MVGTVQVKLEADREGFLPPPSSSTQNQTASYQTPTSNNDSGSAAVAETDEFDNRLSGKNFLDKICLVKLHGKDAEGNADTKFWPALRYSSKLELLDAVKEDVNRSSHFKIVKYFKQRQQKGRDGIAYLLGMQTIEESFIALGEDIVESYVERIDELLGQDEYKCNPKFQLVVAIVEKRLNEQVDFSDEDDDKDDDTQSHDETVAFDNTLSSPSSNNEVSAEVITIEDTPAKGDEKKKRRGVGKDDGAGSKKKKKKISKQTPKAKSRATLPPMVTPLPAKSGDEDIAKSLRKARSKFHRVMKHEAAWKLLEEKFGFTCVDGKFYLPPLKDTSISVDDKPVASSLMSLRKDLCEKGLPESIQPLSRDEKIDIGRWVRYAHVKGLRDGQDINPDDLGMQIKRFMHAWVVLCDNFGCSYSNKKYNVPLTPNGEEIQTFESDSDVDRHFARFGIQCIPDNPGDKLSQEDRLSIELFFAIPSFNVLNTFKRIDEKAKRKRARKPVSYGE